MIFVALSINMRPMHVGALTEAHNPQQQKGQKRGVLILQAAEQPGRITIDYNAMTRLRRGSNYACRDKRD